VKLTLKERFSKKIFVDSANGCWLWRGAIDSDGYALMHIGRKSRRAHRMAWTLFRGEIPAGLLVCHKCDVRFCVNPEHLFLGTYAENSADMKRKGRQRKGEKNPTARLNAEQVRMIRGRLASGEAPASIAARVGVTEAAIKQIRVGRNWRHVLPVGIDPGLELPVPLALEPENSSHRDETKSSI
jgi:hypothetical protein